MEINVLPRLWENRCKSCDRWHSADDIIYRWPQPQTEVTDIVLVVTWSVYFMYFFTFLSLCICVYICVYISVYYFFHMFNNIEILQIHILNKISIYLNIKFHDMNEYVRRALGMKYMCFSCAKVLLFMIVDRLIWNTYLILPSQIYVLYDKYKLYYLLKGTDTEITPIFGKWLCEINKVYNIEDWRLETNYYFLYQF